MLFELNFPWSRVDAKGDAILARICALSKPAGPLRDELLSLRYRECRQTLTVARLTAYLRPRPSLIEQWTLYSADKRTPGGFYLMDPEHASSWWGKKSWTVGRLLNAGKHEDWSFPDGATACAEYILRELDFWQNLQD